MFGNGAERRSRTASTSRGRKNEVKSASRCLTINDLPGQEQINQVQLGRPFMSTALDACTDERMRSPRGSGAAFDAFVVLEGVVVDYPFMSPAFDACTDKRMRSP